MEKGMKKKKPCESVSSFIYGKKKNKKKPLEGIPFCLAKIIKCF